MEGRSLAMCTDQHLIKLTALALLTLLVGCGKEDPVPIQKHTPKLKSRATCTTDADCVPPDVCTKATCNTTTGQCVFTPKPSCCVDNGDCVNVNPCSVGCCNV